jgi:hypothetical protein
MPVVLTTIKELYKVRTPDPQISFDRWLITAKEHLKWNDYCIHLFWDMLQAAVRCKDEMKSGWEFESDLIEIEYISLFLALHIPDASSRQTSPTTAYDTMWPHAINNEEIGSGSSSNSGGSSSGGDGNNIDAPPLSPTKSPHGSPRKHFFSLPTGNSSPRFVLDTHYTPRD